MSATQGNYITLPGLSVVGDLSAKQYMAVKLSTATANTVLAIGATTTVAVGVLIDAPDAAGEAATVASLGVVTMVAGSSTITAGLRVGYDTTGRAEAGNVINFGVALEPSAAIGDHIKVLLMGPGTQ
jgi:hypothetical protein